MRPRGEISQALLQAARQGGPGTMRDLARRACVGFDAARYTVITMAQRGELKVVGTDRIEYAGMPYPKLVRIYEAAPGDDDVAVLDACPGGDGGADTAPFVDLENVFRHWQG